MKTCSLHETEKLEPAQLAAMLAFIPVLEDAAFCPGRVIPMEEDGLPVEAFTKTVSRFMDACYKNGFVVRFNWEAWEAEARGYLAEPARIQQADLSQVRRLLTWHVRQNRFSRDHLATMLAQGHVLAILKRLNELAV